MVEWKANTLRLSILNCIVKINREPVFKELSLYIIKYGFESICTNTKYEHEKKKLDENILFRSGPNIHYVRHCGAPSPTQSAHNKRDIAQACVLRTGNEIADIEVSSFGAIRSNA